MSSKVLQTLEGLAVHPISWRPSGAQPAKTHNHVATPAPQVPHERLFELQQQGEANARASYNQGVVAGDAAATMRAQQKLDPVLNGLSGIITELASLRKRFRAEAEDDTMKLAIAIARRVINRELATDSDAILGLVKAAFGKLNARETHKLRVCPSDVKAIEEHRVRLQIPPGLEIVSDGLLTPGSAIFETSRGDLDASVDTQLTEIDRGLADILKRRK